MKASTILKAGGIYNGLCALLHAGFPGMFKWNDVLALLPPDKSPFLAQPLYIMNWCMLIFWIILAWIPLFNSQELLKPGIGRTLLSSLVVFWIIRIFILQPVYIGLSAPVSWYMIGFFSIGLLLFAIPLMMSIKQSAP